MSIEEVSLYFLGGDPIPYFGLVPIDPRSSLTLNMTTYSIAYCDYKTIKCKFEPIITLTFQTNKIGNKSANERKLNTTQLSKLLLEDCKTETMTFKNIMFF